MHEYLSTLHKRPSKHKKRFALIASASVTLVILIVWSVVRFGFNHEVAKVTTGPVNLAAVSEADISAFSRVISDIKSSWYNLTHFNSDGQ